jgi:hypothetical protein
VLRVYLPTCTTSELRTVFGPIECFWMEADGAEDLIEFSSGTNGPRDHKLKLMGPGPS